MVTKDRVEAKSKIYKAAQKMHEQCHRDGGPCLHADDLAKDASDLLGCDVFLNLMERVNLNLIEMALLGNEGDTVPALVITIASQISLAYAAGRDSAFREMTCTKKRAVQ
jgi:hypothetical protein